MPRLSKVQRTLKELGECAVVAFLLDDDDVAEDFLLAYALLEAEEQERSVKKAKKEDRERSPGRTESFGTPPKPHATPATGVARARLQAEEAKEARQEARKFELKREKLELKREELKLKREELELKREELKLKRKEARKLELAREMRETARLESQREFFLIMAKEVAAAFAPRPSLPAIRDEDERRT